MPLGLLGLAVGCVALVPSAFGHGLTPAGLQTAAVFALLFGAGCQLLAGLMSLANKNVLSGTVFTTFAFLWLVNAWAFNALSNGTLPDHSVGLGYGDRVATATSMSTPHAGYRPALSMGSSWFGMRTDADYITGEFAAAYPEDQSVPRYSWAAASCAYYDQACLARYDDEVIAAALATTYETVRTAYLDDSFGGDNDGVVPVSAAQWGTFLGVLPADHWDLVGQIPAQRLGFFDHLGHYLNEARRLRTAELELEL